MSVTAIFDGHGGTVTADLARSQILDFLSGNDLLWESLGVSHVSLAQQHKFRQAWHQVFSQLDSHILHHHSTNSTDDGSTAILSMFIDDHLCVVNAGDCRAVLSRDGSAKRLSNDHKPESPAEHQRIMFLGGNVLFANGHHRVCSSCTPGAKMLSVSRGLGDVGMKEPVALVSCEPDITMTALVPVRDSFVVLASDGLWGSVCDQDAVDVVERVLAESPRNQRPADIASAAARALVRAAQDQGSVDDITVVVQLLHW